MEVNNTEAKKLFNKNFLLMLQGSLFSNFGDILYSIAIGYYVYNKTGSEAMMGIFTSISMFVTMFLSPITGAIVDRISRKAVIIGMDAVRGIIMLIIGFLCLNNNLDIGTLISFTVIISLSNVMFRPAIGTVLVDIVPKKDFVQANSITTGVLSVIDLISKGISGVLLVYVGVGQLIVFNGISFIFSAFTECFIYIPKTPKQGTKVSIKIIFMDVIDGLKDIMSIKALKFLFSVAIILNFFVAGIFSLFLVFTTQKGYSLEQYGVLISTFSLGSLIGALFVSLFKIPDNKRHPIMCFSFLGFGVTFIISLMSNNFYITFIFIIISAFFNSLSNMILNSSMMLLMPNDKRAAILGFIMASSTGGTALSTLTYGFLAETFPIYIVGTIGMLIAIIPIICMFTNKSLKEAVSNVTK